MKFDMAGVSVFLAMPSHRHLHPYTVRSLLDTQRACWDHNVPLSIEVNYGTSLVHHARNKATHAFLNGRCTHLFMIDSDMVWKPDDFIRFLAFATELECVAASYTCKTDEPRFCLNVKDLGARFETNEYGCFPFKGGGLGLGFTCVQRKVMEELAHRAKKVRYPDKDELVAKIFRCDEDHFDDRGEDMAFFSDVAALGYTVNLDPSVSLGHIGDKEYRAVLLDHLQKEETSTPT